MGGKEGDKRSSAAATILIHLFKEELTIFPVSFKALSQILALIRTTNYCNNPFVLIQTCRDSWLCVRQGGSLRRDLSQLGVPSGGFSCQLSTNSVTSSVSFPKQDTQSHTATWNNSVSTGFPRETSQ